MRKHMMGWMRAAALAFVATAACESSAQPSFRGLGFLPGFTRSSAATGVSGDGSVIVGWSQAQSGPAEALRWDRRTGEFIGLGMLPAPFDRSTLATSVSADGSVIAGTATRPNAQGSQAFRWTRTDGLHGLGFLPGDGISTGEGISGDGSTVIGISVAASGINHAFRWTAATGAQPLPSLIGPSGPTTAWAISPTTRVVVGWSSTSSGGTVACLWDSAGNIHQIGDFPGGIEQSVGFAVSDSGVAVGYGFGTGPRTAFRWSDSTGLVALDDLPGGPFGANANDLSADGAVIVGLSNAGPGLSQAVIWDQAGHVRRIADVLTSDFGLDLAGWNLESATAISADGRVIVGSGTDPQGHLQGWVAVIPAPSGAIAVAFAACFMKWRRRA